ncbi:MAG: response regulator [Eubacteriales bacterium]|nr:response regulator [Eubacteriales bacterium]
MEILLVDDEIYTIQILQTAIDWNSHGVNQVWSALGVAKARELLLAHPVDLVICDIEMPKETGLDLLTWIRETGYDTELILLTCHTDFSYAKAAVSLGAYDYCVKPIIVEEIEKVIAKALEHIQESRKMRKALEESVYLERKRKIVDTSFWKDTLEGRNGSTPEELLKHAKENNLALELDDTFCMALFSAKFVEEERLDYRKITQDYFEKAGEENLFVVVSEQKKWTVLVKNRTAETFRNLCSAYLEFLHEEKGLRIIGCFHPELYCEELVTAYRGLYETEKMMTSYQENLWNAREVKQKHAVDAELDGGMEQLLYSGAFAEFADTFEEYLYKKQWKHPISVSALYTLRADICQSLDVYLKGRGISAHTLFQEEELCRKMNEATLSVEHMMRFVRCLAQTIPYENNVTDITNAVKKYIFQHLSEDIGRDDIVEALHLNGDYIARVFKKDTGMSISQYVNQERMNQAKLLIATTALPVGDVACSVGYTNFSYFSKLFRQFAGCTPREYKLRMRGNEK